MRLLLLEDQPALSEAISSHLKAHGFVVDSFFDIQSAESALSIEEFGAALMDLSLPDGDGLKLLARLRNQGARIPIIIMTARDQIRDRIKGLEAGADDYLVKPFDLDEMIARVHAVTRRYGGNPSPYLSFGAFDVDRVGHRVLVAGIDASVTAKEWALIEKLISQPTAIFTKEQLKQALYNFSDEVESNTVEVYVSRLRKKLGKASIETVKGLGYRINYG